MIIHEETTLDNGSHDLHVAFMCNVLLTRCQLVRRGNAHVCRCNSCHVQHRVLSRLLGKEAMSIRWRIDSILGLRESTEQGYCDILRLWIWTSCLT